MFFGFVHGLLVHPRENDLHAGTYGRGIYITDKPPIREMNEDVLREDVYFFKVEPKAQLITNARGWYHLYGNQRHFIPNEPNVLVINYYLKDKVNEKIRITITDTYGYEFTKLEGKTNSGINRVMWDTRRRLSPEEEVTARRERERDPFSRMVPPGKYVVILEVGNKRFTQKAHITKRIGWTIGPAPRQIGDGHSDE